MAFFATVVKGGKETTEVVPDPLTLVVTNAALAGKTSQPVLLTASTEGYDRIVLCTLTWGRIEQAKLDVIFEGGREIKFKVEGDGEVHLLGYFQPTEDLDEGSDEEGFGFEDEEEEGDAMDESDEEEDESAVGAKIAAAKAQAQAAAKKTAAPAAKQGGAAPAAGKASPAAAAKPAQAAGAKSPSAAPKADAKPATPAGAATKKRPNEEAASPAAEGGPATKKRKVGEDGTASPATPAPAAKATTPGKAAPATSPAAKSPAAKPEAKSPAAAPAAAAAGKSKCDPCNRTFNSDAGLQQHVTTKHGATKK